MGALGGLTPCDVSDVFVPNVVCNDNVDDGNNNNGRKPKRNREQRRSSAKEWYVACPCRKFEPAHKQWKDFYVGMPSSTKCPLCTAPWATVAQKQGFQLPKKPKGQPNGGASEGGGRDPTAVTLSQFLAGASASPSNRPPAPRRQSGPGTAKGCTMQPAQGAP